MAVEAASDLLHFWAMLTNLFFVLPNGQVPGVEGGMLLPVGAQVHFYPVAPSSEGHAGQLTYMHLEEV